MSETNAFSKPFDSMAATAQDSERLKQLEFHLETGDYFPLLATVLCFLEEGMKECEVGNALTYAPIESEILKNVRQDLLYLHKNYSIQPKINS